MEPQLKEQPDLRSYLGTLWRRKWLFLAILISIPAAVFVISNLVPKNYQAMALLQVKAINIDPTAATALTSIETEALLFETDKVAAEAADKLGEPEASAGNLVGSVQVEPLTSGTGTPTDLVRLTASAEDATRAARLANAYGRAIDAVRSRKALRQIDKSVQDLEARKRDAPDDATKIELARQLQFLESARDDAVHNTEVVQPATPPDTPVSPRPRRNTALAAVVALLLALGAVTVRERLDRRLRESGELEPLLGVPLLSVIPRAAFPGARPAPGVVRESFRTLAASLIYFNVERALKTVLVASPTQGDGKTTVALHLAVALARSGQNVIAIEGDLRHPQLAVRLGIEPATGLVEVLTNQAELDASLVDVDVGEEDGGRLRVLGAGKRPPNPARLLGSKRMQEVLSELSAMAEIVVLDTPPILNVSDALPLLDRVSGIVLVAQVGTTSQDALLRTRQVIEAANGSILGAVATGSITAGLYGYGTEYYEADALAAMKQKAAAKKTIESAAAPEAAHEDSPKAQADVEEVPEEDEEPPAEGFGEELEKAELQVHEDLLVAFDPEEVEANGSSEKTSKRSRRRAKRAERRRKAEEERAAESIALDLESVDGHDPDPVEGVAVDALDEATPEPSLSRRERRRQRRREKDNG